MTESLFSVNSYCREDSWVFDTAASHHFCKDKSLFSRWKPLRNEKLSVAVDGVTFPVEGCGEIELFFNNTVYILSNVLYTPKLRRNLVSGPRIDVRGGRFVGEKGKISVFGPEGEFLFIAKLRNGIYSFNPQIKVQKANSDNIGVSRSLNTKHIHAFNINSVDLWHSRYAHIGKNLVISTSKNNSAIGLPKLNPPKSFCEPCQISKQKRVSFKPLTGEQTNHPLQRVYLDVGDPFQ